MRIRARDSIYSRPRPSARTFLFHNQTQSICLPQSLAQSVPSCAISCVQSFIRANYNDTSCFTTGNLTFLCTSRNLSGHTIGEGALQCVVSSCFEPDLSTEGGINICNGIAGALPRTAGHLTATISAISATASNEITSVFVTATETTFYSAVSSTMTPQPKSTNIISSTLTPTDSISSPHTSGSSNPTVTFSGVLTASTAPGATSIMSNTRSSSSSSLEPTGSAIPAGQVLTRGLSTGAIAGIIAASILFTSIAFAFLIYWFCMRRRRARHQNSQQSSTAFPYESAGSTEHTTVTTPISIGTASVRRLQKPYRPSGTVSRKRTSLWQRRFPAFENADSSMATNKHGRSPSVGFSPILRPPSRQAAWPTLRVINPDPESMPQQYGRPLSDRLSFDEDLEAVDQELPALRSSHRTESSSRSVSSGGIEKPAPLKISMSKNKATSSTQIPLTPTYDNGNFDNPYTTSDRERNQQLLPPRTSSLQPRNIHHRDEKISTINLPRIPQVVAKPALRLYSDQVPSHRARSALPNLRKQSVTTDRSLSIYTEIEEDETPDEKDRRLEVKPNPSPEDPQTPVRDLRWPAIPRSASIAKQAEHVPRPRGPRPFRLAGQLAAHRYHRDELVAQRKSFIRTNTSSSENTTEVCAAFPMPPNFSKVGIPQQSVNHDFTSSNNAGSRPYSTNVARTAQGLVPVTREQQQPSEYLPPLAQRYQNQGFRTMSSSIPPRSPRQMAQELSNARFTPNRSNTGDLYLTVDL